jgi:hypothetical protein
VLRHRHSKLDLPSQHERSHDASTGRYASTLRQRLARFDADEREAGKWQNRLKHVVLFALFASALVALCILVIAFPWMYPKDLKGLEILSGVSIVLSVYFVFAYYLQEWVESRMEYFWFWRISSVLLCLGIAGGMLYAMFSTADLWLPHYR